MSRPFRHINPWWLAPVLLALIAFLPALASPDLPGGADVTIHYWRTFDLTHAWSLGDLMPAWSTLFHYGYGSPGPAYTGGSAYVIAGLAGLLPGIEDVTRIKVVWGLGLLLASLGLYRFAARRWGAQVGLIVAASCVFAPATVFIEPIARGSFGVTLGIGAFCMALALLDKTIDRDCTRWHVALFAVMMLIMLQAHNLTSISGLAVLLAWGWYTLLFRRPLPDSRDRMGEILVVIVFGSIAMSGLLWVTVLLASDAVSLDRMAANENLDYRRHFETLGALLSPPAGYDPAMINPIEKRSLGVVSWVLAAGGAVVMMASLRWRSMTPPIEADRPVYRHEAWFWLVVALTCILLTLPITRPLWDRIGLLQTFRFPTRFLNFAAPALALLAAPGVAWALSRLPIRAGKLLVGGLLAALIVQGVTVMPWETIKLPAEATTAGYFDYELTTGILGGTSANEFLPSTVRDVPPPTGLLMDSLVSDPAHALRVNPFAYPEGTTFEVLRAEPRDYQIGVEAPQAITLELFHFAFQNWLVEVDGQRVEARISDPYGFVLVDVPAGEHVVRLYDPLHLGPHLLGLILVGFGMGSIIAIVLLWEQRPDRLPRHSAPAWTAVLLLIGFAVAWLTFRPGVLWTASAPGEARLAQQSAAESFADGQIRLLGYSVELPQPDALWRISLFWALSEDVATDLNSFVHVLNADGQIVTQHDKFASSAIISNPQWTPERHVRDEYLPRLTSALPPGDYRIRVGWWRCPEGDPTSCPAAQELGTLILPQTITLP